MHRFLAPFLVVYLVLSANTGRGAEPVDFRATHEPAQPHPGETVTITVVARGAPGFTKLVLEYQVVDPGKYVELASPAYARNWTAREMAPQGSRASAQYRVELPAELQTHRRLVRYRFRGTAPDGKGFEFPSAKSPRPNLAYFVYGGVPAWSGAAQPGTWNPVKRQPLRFDTNAMQRVQSYHLIARSDAVENVTWKRHSHDNEYRDTGSLVVDGVVHDHVRFRARGGVWRYAMGKNMWKFDLPDGHPLHARDDYGRPYRVPWGKVNLRACIQQGDYGMRGEQGLFESVGLRLFNLAAVPAPYTHWIQLRIIRKAEEAPADQYDGDFWGLYLAFEDIDGRFLKSHELPAGNVFEMENGGGKLRNPTANAVSDGSDLTAFMNAYQRGRRPVAWWREQLDLPSYYSYRAICECIHHYDIGDGKNYFFHRATKTGRWRVIPWDTDLTWGDHMYGSGDEPFRRTVLREPVFRREFENRLREIRDLLFNPAETDRLIDECAAIIADPNGAPSPVQADRAKWDYHPVMAANQSGKSGQGLFYQAAPSRDFAGMVRLMKSYVRQRGAWIDRTLLGSAPLPPTPTLPEQSTATGAAGSLAFRLESATAPGGVTAVQWRLAEIAEAPTKAGRPTAPGSYEITPVWESGDLVTYSPNLELPTGKITPGRTYRVRARFRDASGVYGHWSNPAQFVAGK